MEVGDDSPSVGAVVCLLDFATARSREGFAGCVWVEVSVGQFVDSQSPVALAGRAAWRCSQEYMQCVKLLATLVRCMH